jgi:hypothetical protein
MLFRYRGNSFFTLLCAIWLLSFGLLEFSVARLRDSAARSDAAGKLLGVGVLRIGERNSLLTSAIDAPRPAIDVIAPVPPWFETLASAAVPGDHVGAVARVLQPLSPGQLLASLHAAPSEQRFFFFWTTPWSQWREVHDWFLDSLFVHNPGAHVFCVYTVAFDGSSHPLQHYADAGYPIHLFHFILNEDTLAWSTNAATRAWLLKGWARGSQGYGYSHVTDYLRFYLLYAHGGTYVDTDAIFLRTLPPGDFIGFDRNDQERQFSAPVLQKLERWFFFPGRHMYLAPGVMRATQKQPFLRATLELAFDNTRYDPDCYNCVGPRALNAAFLTTETTPYSLTLFDSPAFYPFGFSNAHRLLNASEPFAPMLAENLRRRSLALHLFGKMTSGLPVESGSVLNSAVRSFSLLPDPLSCVLGGQNGDSAPVLVVLGGSTAFRDANLLFFQACPLFIDQFLRGETVTVRVEVQAGSFSLAGAKSASAPVRSLAEANALLASLVYHVGPSAARDTVTISVASPQMEFFRAEARLLAFDRLVTVISHTHVSCFTRVVCARTLLEQRDSQSDSHLPPQPTTTPHNNTGARRSRADAL